MPVAPPASTGGGESGPKRKGRRTVEVEGPLPSIPTTGRNPWHKRSSRARRSAPDSAGARRRRLSRTQRDEFQGWLERLSPDVLNILYRGLGGQPGRVGGDDRMIQLALRALGQPSRVGTTLKGMQDRDRQALATLVQAGGVAHSDELHRELILSLGGHEREWARSMALLGDKGLVVASEEKGGEFFYIVPEPLMDGLVIELHDEMVLPVFEHEDVRVVDEVPFSPPLGFTITSLATYIDQFAPRLTQRHDIYRHDQEAMDAFFSQIWTSDSELFAFHLDFMLMNGMIELRGEYLGLNRDVADEWLQLEPEDQRDLIFRALGTRFPLAEWVMWVVYEAGGWVAERPLMALYRRWRKGEEWRKRFFSGSYSATKSSERESFSFAPLVRSGILDMGQWGQEKFYRVSARGMNLLEPPEDDGFLQFYLTPSFEIMAPAGLAPVLLGRIGELAELTGCDRANTYKITEESIERAIKAGWRRDDVLQFLRDNSQIGLPENVEATIKGWIGHRGNVEFHELMLMTVHRSQIKRLEGNKKIKPFLLHRFGPGMYAVDPNRKGEIEAALEDMNFEPSKDVRRYPGDPSQADARAALHRMLIESREGSVGPTARAQDQVAPEALHPIPGSRVAKKPARRAAKPTKKMDATEVISVLERAMAQRQDVELVYAGRSGEVSCVVEPHRRTIKDGEPILLGVDRGDGAKKTFIIEKVVVVRPVEA